ncbi:MAG: MBL fold metallo-hydrolase [Betaproteobacteria bacterium]|nr:MAG: MBL fold metallo-hydrolase [Betaproteobacteria bacterium]
MKYLNTICTVTAVVTFAFLAALPANAENIKVTPLGSHEGEFCYKDRALILEDPDGTRILYDPGRTVVGAKDSRLGKIDVVLVTHMHGDHVGNEHISDFKLKPGNCDGEPKMVNDLPNTNAVNIAIAKDALIVTGSEMYKFFAAKLKAHGGKEENSLPVGFGASRKVGGVTITTVPAVHPNGVDWGMIEGLGKQEVIVKGKVEKVELVKLLSAAGLTAYVGPATGYVLIFSNGLAVYLSGDTGITAEQDTVVRQYYGAKLVVMNIGDKYTTGPNEAAWVINELIKPVSVIASHANEAATKKGKVIPGTKTDSFIKATKNALVLVPLSGTTMEFDGVGNCVAGC